MRYNIGFMLGLNISSFRSGMRGAAAEVRGFERVQNKSLAKMQRAQAGMARTGSMITAYVAGIYTGVAAFSALTMASAKFDFQARALSAVMKESVSWGKEFHKTAVRYNASLREFNPEEITSVARALSQAGYDMRAGGIANVSAVLTAVTASLGAIKPQEAVELGINLERGFGRGTRGMSELLDVAVEGSNMFPMTLDKITTSMGYATESAVSYGQSLESVIVALGALMPVVKTASKAGVAYRNTMAAIARPTTAKFMEKHGIHLRNAANEYRDLMDIVADVYSATSALRAKDAKDRTHKYEQLIHKMFGIRGKSLFAAFQQLPQTVKGPGGMELDSPTEAYNYLRSQLAMAGGASARLADSMRLSTQIIDQKFNASMSRASIIMGEQLAPTVNRLKHVVTDLIDSFFGASAKMGSAVSAVRMGFNVSEHGPSGKGLVSAVVESLSPMLLAGLAAMTAGLAVTITKFLGLAIASMGGSKMLTGGAFMGNPASAGAWGGGSWKQGSGSRIGNFLGFQQGGRATSPHGADGARRRGLFGIGSKPGTGQRMYRNAGAGAFFGSLLKGAMVMGVFLTAVEAMGAGMRELSKVTHTGTEIHRRNNNIKRTLTSKAVGSFLKTLDQGGVWTKDQAAKMGAEGTFSTVTLMSQLYRNSLNNEGEINKKTMKKGGLAYIVKQAFDSQKAQLLLHAGKNGAQDKAVKEQVKALDNSSRGAQAETRKWLLGKKAPKKVKGQYQARLLEMLTTGNTWTENKLAPEALDTSALQARPGGKRGDNVGKHLNSDTVWQQYFTSAGAYAQHFRDAIKDEKDGTQGSLSFMELVGSVPKELALYASYQALSTAQKDTLNTNMLLADGKLRLGAPGAPMPGGKEGVNNWLNSPTMKYLSDGGNLKAALPDPNAAAALRLLGRIADAAEGNNSQATPGLAVPASTDPATAKPQ
jgi:TP901 family phage tail tape measure protein